MKSIRTGIIATALVAGLLMLVPAGIQAQPTTLSIILTVSYQNPNVKQPTTENGDITATGLASLKVSSASIQTLILSNLVQASAMTQAGAPLTSLKGYTLIWDQNDSLLGETNSKTGDFQSVSDIITINTDASGSGDLVTAGTSDTSDPIAQTLSTTSEWNITFADGAGNTFNVYGLVKTTVSLNGLSTTQQANGVTQTATISFSGSVTGYGTILDKQGNTDNATFTGAVAGGGKGPQGS